MIPKAKKKAFVLMPFNPRAEFDGVYAKLICPALREAGFDEVRRSDKEPHSRNVLEEIMEGIGMSDLLVAVLTRGNANVYL
jgi:hypothetical protein